MTNMEEKIEKAAQELANEYNSKKYRLGSVKRYSINDIWEIINKAEESFEEPYKTQMREQFHALVGLNGDRGRAQDKLHRDFPG